LKGYVAIVYTARAAGKNTVAYTAVTIIKQCLFMLLNKNIIAAVAGFFLYCCPSHGQALPAKKDVLKKMQRANAYFMRAWPDAGKTIITNKKRPSNIWTRAVYYEGLMALYSIDKNTSYYDYAVQWGGKHQWSLNGGTKVRNADNQCCGQTYIELYMLDRKEERIKDIKTCIDNMMNTEKNDDWNWIDAIQMAMPVFARFGILYKDSSYFKRMYEMYAFSKYKHGGNGLYNPVDHLWWRDKDFVPPYKEPNGEDCYWSRGNGWVVAALVRTLSLLPKTSSYFAAFMQDYKDMTGALLPLQRTDGYWNVSLHDSTHFGGKELSGTALFVYGMAWGINNGYLSRKEYLPAVVSAWNAMQSDAVQEDGALGYVQGTGKEPKDGQPVTYASRPDFEDYGLGCFLLAGAEVYKLKK
jgi:unsaturated rhamnogalacturonyl hydrolase